MFDRQANLAPQRIFGKSGTQPVGVLEQEVVQEVAIEGIILTAAGTAAEGVVLPLLDDPISGFQRFAETFEARSCVSPDSAAAQAHDATRLLIAAIRKARTEPRAHRSWRSGTRPMVGSLEP